jgi:uncharacterized protein YijF (DUF1287 family)
MRDAPKTVPAATAVAAVRHRADLRTAPRLFAWLLSMALTTAAGPASATPDVTRRVLAAALARTTHVVRYDGSYRRIAYPGGDVPDDVGVCTDLVIRSYRGAGIDLQRAVHEDMRTHFGRYPTLWGLHRPDPNIDHRRVPNLETFFRRHGKVLALATEPAAYQPGDLVTWRLPGNLPHIGIITDRRSDDGKRPLVVHNIGQGPRLEDMLFEYPITGHYRYPAR